MCSTTLFVSYSKHSVINISVIVYKLVLNKKQTVICFIKIQTSFLLFLHTMQCFFTKDIEIQQMIFNQQYLSLILTDQT